MSTTTQVGGRERLAQVVPDAIAAIHEVLERHNVTEDEWYAALEFLKEVGDHDEFVLLSDVTRTSVLIDALSHGADESATPSDVEGPLYRPDPPWREAPVKIYEDYDGVEAGEVLFVRGKVTSTDGGESGEYEFQTMIPKPYTVPTDGPVGRYLDAIGQHPWRPAHIHFKVTAEGHEPLVTQVFFAGDPYLGNDTIGAVKESLVRSPAKHEDEAELRQRGLEAPFFTCDFDVRLRPSR